MRGITPTEFTFQLYGQLQPNINMELTAPTYIPLFAGEYYPIPSVKEIVEENRQFGHTTTFDELLLQSINIPPEKKERIMKTDWNCVLYETLSTQSNYEALIAALNHRETVKKEFYTDSAVKIIKEFKIELSILNNLFLAMQERKGVQVVFGPPNKLKKFLEEANAQAVDDYTATLKTTVPGELVMAIIPLGSYEEKALLSST